MRPDHVYEVRRSAKILRQNPGKTIHLIKVLIKREELRTGFHRMRGDPYVVGRNRPAFSTQRSCNSPKSIGRDQRYRKEGYVRTEEKIL